MIRPAPRLPCPRSRARRAASFSAGMALAVLLSACQDQASTGTAPPSAAAAAPSQPANPAMTALSPSAPASERARFIADRADALQRAPQDAAAQVSAALQDDAPAVVLALARSPASADGRALALWARALWQAGEIEPLARVLVQLALGADLQQDAVQHFGAGPAAEDGSPSHANAVALGYFIGALQAGLDATRASQADRQALVTRLLRSAAAQAGVPEPGPALPPPDASTGARWVRYNLVPALAAAGDADARLEAAALPLAMVGVRANGEPDLEIAVGSNARAAFARRQQASRRALDGQRP